MPSWEETHAAAISAFGSVVNDVGGTYQQVLFSGAGVYQSQDISRELSQRVVNPEYTRAERAYAAQEQEREYWEGITVDDYQHTDLDWREYGRYSAEWDRENPDPRLTGLDPDAPDIEEP